MSIAHGLTFVSFACAILFAFFKRTEPIAWVIIDQWLMLIVQTVAIALIQALVVSFFLAGAATNSGLVVVGIGLVCLVFMLILLWSGVKTVWRSFNGLFDAISKATGGVFATPGEAAKTALSAGSALATGGLSLAGNALGGASTLMSGGSWAQAAGVAFGGSQTLTGAARMITRLPGLGGSELEEAADHFVEGAATRQVARNVPLVGRIAGPMVGAALLSDRNPDNTYEDENGNARQPMLVPAVGRALSGFTQGPRWKRNSSRPDFDDDAADELPGGAFTPLDSPRMGRFTPIAPVSTATDETLGRDIAELDVDETVSRQRSDYATREDDEIVGQQVTNAVNGEAGETRSGSGSLDNAANRLEHAADALTQAAHAQQMEGRLDVSGPANVASAMGDTVSLLQMQQGSASLQGVDNFTLAGTMAQAVGVTPVENGKPPIENDLARFGVFANQALTMGISGEQTERAAREVKESPESKLTPETRSELVDQMAIGRGMFWTDANSEVDHLENGARMLPNEISAYGTMSIPTASPFAPAMPTINVAPQVDVRPNVQVTVEANNDSSYAEGLKDQASMTGSQAILSDSTAGQQEE